MGKLNFYIGKAIRVKQDEYHGELIKVRLEPDDAKRSEGSIPYAIPALPKMLHIKPKVGEAVIVLVDETSGQRLYVGPLISQPQKMTNDQLSSAVSILGGGKVPDESIDKRGDSQGAMPKDEDIAILGRKNTDIILTEDDIKIRAGVRVTDSQKGRVEFNRDAPAFIKLKYHKTPITTEFTEGTINGHAETRSTATIFADKINLISPNGDGWDKISDRNELVEDDKMSKLIGMAHQLPYGDELCKFLSMFLMMYMNHTHPYHGMPPLNADPDSVTFWTEYNPNQQMLENKLLSKDIRIN